MNLPLDECPLVLAGAGEDLFRFFALSSVWFESFFAVKEFNMSSVQVTHKRSWFWLLAVSLPVVVLGGVYLLSSHEDSAQVSGAQGVAQVASGATADAQVAASAASTQEPSNVVEQVVAKAVAEQKEAAKVVERQPEELTPIVGSVKERPEYVTTMEWTLLKGVADANVHPDQELNRLVNFLRFNKKLELFESLPGAQAPARRMALGEQLIQELPTRVRNSEMDLKEAQRVLNVLLPGAVPDEQARAKRERDVMDKLSKIVVTQSATH